ncbi:MAG: outer membrane beta-barrel protein [Lacibacter sp.]
MSPKLLLLILGISMSSSAFAQSTIKGKITDTSTSTNLKMAVISLIQAKDSVLLQFTRADEKGQFELKNIKEGRYILMVSFPGFADYVEDLEVETLADINKTIFIIPKTKLLEEIIIQQKVAAIRMKGDTTEFKADSFKVGPNANVQDLLKRLPGLQVNAKGEITAQGQKVEKVLVDGEEFFSDDPAVVTQNLRADVVDKVQVFDKKSEQAEFSGIDDGQKTKTINLELKEDKKKGYFGKLEAGTDAQNYYNDKGMINAFRKKRKIAAYITTNNTSFQDLNWSEQRNFGANNMNIEMNEDGGMFMWNEGDEFNRGQGLPQSVTAGASYINKWNKDKQGINSSFQFNDQQVNGINGSITKTILPDTTFTNTTSEHFNTWRQRKKLFATYDWQIDSTSSFKLKASGSLVNNERISEFTGRSISEENTTINETRRTTNNKSENQDFTSELNWKKRLKKAGRTISITGNFSSNLVDGDGFLFADNSFFGKNGNLVTQQNINQKKTIDEKRQTVQSSLTYTEPLSKKLMLELNYRNAFNQNNSLRNTLEQSVNGGQYDKLVDSLSNHFLFKTSDHSGGFTIRFTEKKYTLSIGTGVGRTNFELEELRKNQQRSIGFTNLLPRASIKFTPKKQRSFNLTYNGNTQNPTLLQINPIIDNTDPLNITIGNENLKQAFSHNFTLNISDYKIIKSRNLYLWSSYSFINNAITNANSIDSLGRRVNQSINVNGNYFGNLYGGYGFEIVKSLNFNINVQANINRFINLVNGVRNVNNNYSYGIGFGIYKWSEKALNFGFSLSPMRNVSRSSINKDVVTKYWSLSAYPNLEVKLKKQKLYFNIESNINLYEKVGAFQNQRNIFLINGNVRRTFTKSDALEVKLSVNDLLNQNLGIQRNITSNFVQEQTFQNLRRFFLLSFTWNFSKNGKPTNGF